MNVNFMGLNISVPPPPAPPPAPAPAPQPAPSPLLGAPPAPDAKALSGGIKSDIALDESTPKPTIEVKSAVITNVEEQDRRIGAITPIDPVKQEEKAQQFIDSFNRQRANNNGGARPFNPIGSALGGNSYDNNPHGHEAYAYNNLLKQAQGAMPGKYEKDGANYNVTFREDGTKVVAIDRPGGGGSVGAGTIFDRLGAPDGIINGGNKIPPLAPAVESILVYPDGSLFHYTGRFDSGGDETHYKRSGDLLSSVYRASGAHSF